MEKKIKAQTILIKDFGHEWSGSNLNQRHGLVPNPLLTTKIPFFSSKGPSATNLAWEFFKESLVE